MTGFRKAKSNRNLDDIKVLVIGAIISILLMVGTPKIQYTWESYVADRPFITATIKIVPPTATYSKALILYDADASRNVDGVWIASIQDEEGIQLTVRRGEGSYNTKVDEPRLWSWFAFFDNDKGLNDPGLPNVPFRVCVRYIVKSRDTGVSDETSEYCSDYYTPELDVK